jgi:peptidoglycan/LPS O-acetylase OafA/YrhL
MAASETKHLAEFPLFDWLRIAMAGVVAVGHFGQLSWDYAPNLAVQVFFALSGWLIGSILLGMNRGKLPLFYFNRTTRVWMPYLLTVALLYAVSAARGEAHGRWFEFLAYDLTFTHNLFALKPTVAAAMSQMPLGGTGNHFWSIAVEEQFYLIAPLLILFVPGWRHPASWLVLGIALLFVRDEFSAIALGVAAAAMNHRRPGFHTGALAQLGIAAVLVASSLWLFGDLYLKVAPFFAISLVLLLARTGARGPIGRFVGGVSYPFYLNHWIALIGVSSLAKRLGGNGHAWAIFGLILAFGIGSAAYWFVDRRIQARRGRWYGPRLGWGLAALSYLLVATGTAIGVRLHGNPI